MRIAGFLGCLFVFAGAKGQDANVQEVIQRYSSENAVILKDAEHVVLKYEDGKLGAKSYIEKQVLLLSDLAPGMYNNERVYHSSFNKLLDLEGTSLIPSGKHYKSVKATELKTSTSTSESVFYDDVKQTVITYPSLVKNAITTVKYSIEHKDIHFLPSFYFQSYAPVVTGSFVVTAPKDVHLKYIIMGENAQAIKSSVEETKNTRTYTFSVDNIPKFKTFDNAPAVSYYMPHVLIYVEDYEYKKDDAPTPVLGTVNKLYQFYYPFIRNINSTPDPAILKTVADITQGLSAPIDKARRIYEWVQEHIKYVAFEDGMGGFIPRDAALVCGRKYGDCKDMTSLLVAMCREAGLDAHFTWIGTRSIPYTYAEAPLPSTDNHMICAVNISGKWIFMDGTNPSIKFGVPPYAIQGKEALISINKNSSKVVAIPETPSSANRIVDSTMIKLSSNMISGSVRMNLRGYAAWRLRAQMMYYNDNEKEQLLKSIASRASNKYIQTGFSFKNSDDTERTVLVSSEFEVRDYAKEAGNEWYINMNLVRSYQESWIDIKDRQVPVENDFKSMLTQVVALDIPKGYHVSYLPEVKERRYKDLWGYKISYKQSGSKVYLVKDLEMNTLYIKPDKFTEFNKMIDDLKAAYKESVVLVADK
jgi:hypothetical protein